MASTEPLHPLESFLRDYVPLAGGLWEETEPLVYDLLLPEQGGPADGPSSPPDRVLRVALDPEAVGEHPGSQLLAYGSPLLDAILAEAHGRARVARAHLLGLNLHPQDLDRQAARCLDLPAGAKVSLGPAEALSFSVHVFWFSATFQADQKEQETFVVAIDAVHGRQVRHLEQLLDRSRLFEQPAEVLPEAPCLDLEDRYALARGRVVRSLAAAANLRRRDAESRFARQEARMVEYYRDLREEVEQQMARALRRSDDTARVMARRLAIDREEKLRLAELGKKRQWRVLLRLMNLLEIRQPKLRLEATVRLAPPPATPRALPHQADAVQPLSRTMPLVWDPLLEAWEAPDCPGCRQPTFAVRLPRSSPSWRCPACSAQGAP